MHIFPPKLACLLKNEYDFLFRTLFKNAQLYRRVVELVATRAKGLSQAEIKEALKLSDGGELTKVLENLQKCDFLRTYVPFGSKSNGAIYQLTDLFSLFHLRFISSYTGQDEHYWTNLDDHKKEAWEGYAFEVVCMHHIPQIKERLGIRGVLTNACCWQTKPLTDKNGTQWHGAQIDLLLDRDDNIVNLCEMKYSKSEYAVSESYYNALISRQEIFRHHTSTKKSTIVTFVTTYGLKKNKHSDIFLPYQIVMDDLFD